MLEARRDDLPLTLANRSPHEWAAGAPVGEVDVDLLWMPLAAVGVGGFVLMTRLARRRRLAGVELALANAGQMLIPTRPPAQAEFEAVAMRLREVDTAAAVAERRARSLAIPLPPPPAANSDETVAALVSYLDSRAAQVTVAGGEQLLANLVDMSSAATLGHLLHAATELYQAGFADFAIDLAEHGVTGALAGVLESGVKEFALHGTQGVISAAEQAAEHFHGAGHHLADAFDPADAGGAHFPIFTMLMSTAREGALLMERKTTLERGLAHVAIDTAGTAIGGAGGAKAGALLGSLIAPGVGTAVGGMLGAIAGAVAGRLAAGEVKLMPLKNAVAELTQGINDAKVSIAQSADTMASAVASARDSAQKSYESSLKRAPRAGDAERNAGLTRLAASLAKRLVRCTEVAEQTFDVQVQRIRDAVPTASTWQRVLGLDVRTEADAAIRAFSEAATAKFAAQKRALANLTGDGPQEAVAVLDELGRTALLPSPGTDSAFAESLVNLERCAASLDSSVAQWAAETTLRYNRAVATVVQAGVVQGQRHHAGVLAWRGRLDERTATVQRHRDALGLT